MALQLAADPGKFLSTVQIGITLVGIIAGAYSGATPRRAARRAAGSARRAGALSPTTPGFALVIALTTYFSLVVGELVPKQLALRAAEPIAMAMARPMALAGERRRAVRVAARRLVEPAAAAVRHAPPRRAQR